MGWACGGGHEEVVLLLYAHGADATEEGISEYNGRRLPPLLTLAAERDRVRVVHLLCLLGGHAPEDGAVARDDALAAAANRGHAGVVEYLALAGGRSLGTMRHMTRSPLRVARLFGHAALERSMVRLAACGVDAPDVGPEGDLAKIAKRLEDAKKPKIGIGF